MSSQRPRNVGTKRRTIANGPPEKPPKRRPPLIQGGGHRVAQPTGDGEVLVAQEQYQVFSGDENSSNWWMPSLKLLLTLTLKPLWKRGLTMALKPPWKLLLKCS